MNKHSIRQLLSTSVIVYDEAKPYHTRATKDMR